MESILTSIKKMLGIEEEYEAFDPDIIMHINTALMTLAQIGVGTEGFTIHDNTSVWTDFVSEVDNVEGVKTYVYLKVKSVFDPPMSSAVSEAMKREKDELEWRLNIAADSKEV